MAEHNAERRGAVRHGTARYGTLEGTTKRTHPRSRVCGIRTINRFTWHARFGRDYSFYAFWTYRVIRIKRVLILFAFRVRAHRISRKLDSDEVNERKQARMDHLFRWASAMSFSLKWERCSLFVCTRLSLVWIRLEITYLGSYAIDVNEPRKSHI